MVDVPWLARWMSLFLEAEDALEDFLDHVFLLLWIHYRCHLSCGWLFASLLGNASSTTIATWTKIVGVVAWVAALVVAVAILLAFWIVSSLLPISLGSSRLGTFAL